MQPGCMALRYGVAWIILSALGLCKKAGDPGSKALSKANTECPGSPTLKMAEKIRYGSIKRIGARNGRTVKERFGKIELEQRKKHKCPYCNYTTVKRLALGIWQCRKCGAKFSGKAYSIKKKIPFKEEKELPEKVSEQKEEKNESEV